METQPSTTILLTPEQTKFVQKCIASGRFGSTDEVIREGIRLLEAEEIEYQSALEKARRLVKEGADAVERGEWVEGEAVLAKMAERREKLKAKLGQS
jgi:antitoxin ParD1/3/4